MIPARTILTRAAACPDGCTLATEEEHEAATVGAALGILTVVPFGHAHDARGIVCGRICRAHATPVGRAILAGPDAPTPPGLDARVLRGLRAVVDGQAASARQRSRGGCADDGAPETDRGDLAPDDDDTDASASRVDARLAAVVLARAGLAIFSHTRSWARVTERGDAFVVALDVLTEGHEPPAEPSTPAPRKPLDAAALDALTDDAAGAVLRDPSVTTDEALHLARRYGQRVAAIRGEGSGSAPLTVETYVYVGHHYAVANVATWRGRTELADARGDSDRAAVAGLAWRLWLRARGGRL